jgi:hypothetical protein
MLPQGKNPNIERNLDILQKLEELQSTQLIDPVYGFGECILMNNQFMVLLKPLQHIDISRLFCPFHSREQNDRRYREISEYRSFEDCTIGGKSGSNDGIMVEIIVNTLSRMNCNRSPFAFLKSWNENQICVITECENQWQECAQSIPACR